MEAVMDATEGVQPVCKRKRTSRPSWGTIESSYMARNTHNPIRKIVDQMKIVPNPQKEMIALSIGDPTVFGNLPPAENVKNAVAEVLLGDKHNGYAPSVGYEKSRAAVAAHYTCPEAPLTAKDVIFASGCSGALDLAISVLANAGQNLLVPRPGFSLYMTLADSFGIQCRHYNLLPEKSWEIDLDHLESLIDDGTAAIVINNPSNPCGSNFSKQHIRDILKIADKLKVPIIADEIYAHFVFPGEEYISMASQTEDVPVISCGGLTKRYLLPGWRMGWITLHDRHSAFEKEIRPGLMSLSQRILGPNTVVQGALDVILNNTPQEFFDSTINVVKKNADISYEAMCNIPGLSPIMPAGAMYMMVGIDMDNFADFNTDMDFVQTLVSEQSVFCLPAQCFQYPNYFRVVLTVPEEKLRIACERIAEFCQLHYSKAHEVNGTRGNGLNDSGISP